MDGSFYVYALKDPRKNPARPFYIGKGIGPRAWEHLLKHDDTTKGQRVKEIVAGGAKVLVSKVVEGLTEVQALKVEAELIAALGTVATGGILTNTVVPSGILKGSKGSVVVPTGAQEKAQAGLELIKSSVIELVAANQGGLTNAEVALTLGLKSDFKGGSQDYLSYSVIGLLMKDGDLERPKDSKRYQFVEKNVDL